MSTPVDVRLSLDDFIHQYQAEPFELIDGKRTSMPPQITESSMTGGNLYFQLRLQLQQTNAGVAFIETPFVLTDESQWVKGSRVPDVMFIRTERLQHLMENDPNWRKKPMTMVPDFIAEIISPTDRFSDVTKKVQTYLADGVQLIWVIDPDSQVVIEYQAGSDQQTRYKGDVTLTGGDVIPNFEIQLQQLFET